MNSNDLGPVRSPRTGRWFSSRPVLPALAACVALGACAALGAGEGEVAEIPAGTSLTVQLDEAISTRSTQPGAAISASLAEPIRYEGITLVPAGTKVYGHVAAISEEPPSVSLVFDQLLIGEVSHALEGSATRSLAKRSEMTDEAAKIGGGAAAGAVIGGVVGGDVKGAVVGAAAGAAAGTGVALATKDRWASIGAGARVSVLLESELLLPLPEPEVEDVAEQN